MTTKVDLVRGVEGILPVSLGGTGSSTGPSIPAQVFAPKGNGTQVGGTLNSNEVFSFDGSGVDSPITIGASVAANTMTLTYVKGGLRFRSTTLNSGASTYAYTNSDLTLVLPTGASLGAPNAISARFIVVALNNGGTIELGVCNASGGVNLNEQGLISTTAISGSATSATVVYSAVARTNVAYRVLGIVDNTQATAGTYATSPSLVVPVSGNALAEMGSLGFGQTWQNVTGARTAGTTYYNLTGKSIVISVWFESFTDKAWNFTLTINGIIVSRVALGRSGAGSNGSTPIYGIVPPYGSYVIDGISPTAWNELR